jgi:hypothetical protein
VLLNIGHTLWQITVVGFQYNTIEKEGECQSLHCRVMAAATNVTDMVAWQKRQIFFCKKLGFRHLT